MTPNTALSLHLMGAALILGFGRQLIAAIGVEVPAWVTAVVAGAGLSLTVASLVFAVAARTGHDPG